MAAYVIRVKLAHNAVDSVSYYCERSAAIQGSFIVFNWIASSLAALAMNRNKVNILNCFGYRGRW